MKVPLAGLCIFSLMFLAGVAGAQDVATAFNDANKLYEQGKFAEAAIRYQKIIDGGPSSAPLFFNLGNAYLKSGQIGRAIVAYRRSEELAPRDPEVRANLQFARKQAGGGTAAPGKFWENWLNKLTLNEWTILTFVAVGLLFFTLATRQWRESWRNSLRGISATLGVVALMFIVGLVSALQQRSARVSVVIVQEAVVRRGPYDESPSVFTLRDGAEVKVRDQKNDWLEIVDRSGRTGWLSQKQVMSLKGQNR